jgi:hypothetical protein
VELVRGPLAGGVEAEDGGGCGQRSGI